MRLKKRCCYHCICRYIKKKSPPKVYCTAISDCVNPNGLCDKFKKDDFIKKYKEISESETFKNTYSGKSLGEYIEIEGND